MRVEIQPSKENKGCFTVIPHGPIDAQSYLEFRGKVAPLFAASTKGVLMNLQDVDYISSAGLGVLFELKKSLLSKQSDLAFCNLKPQIKQLFEVVKALPKETIFASMDEADHYFYRIMNDEIERQKKKGGTG